MNEDCSRNESCTRTKYTYDGDGNRLEKSSGKIYWYGAGTEILDESDTSGNFSNEYVFFGGKRMAMRTISSGTIYYYEDDMLGSARTMVQAGQTSPCFDGDFLPFGQEVDYTSTCGSNYRFEGKERDLETGNDDFGARYYRSALGRWLSADWSAVPAPVPYANLTNPQTLNLYAMVSDNPETFADLDGHGCQLSLWTQKTCPASPSTKQKSVQGDNFQPQAQKSTTQKAQQKSNSEKIATRVVMAGEAAVNAEVAKIKITAAAALGAAAPETEGATAIPAALLAISASGNIAAAGVQTVGAITGKTDEADLAAKVATVATSPTGMATLIASHGNIQKAARWAAVEGVVTASPKELLGGSAVQITAKVIDFIQNVKSIF
jgi:RHS repeat-associated protein